MRVRAYQASKRILSAILSAALVITFIPIAPAYAISDSENETVALKSTSSENTKLKATTLTTQAATQDRGKDWFPTLDMLVGKSYVQKIGNSYYIAKVYEDNTYPSYGSICTELSGSNGTTRIYLDEMVPSSNLLERLLATQVRGSLSNNSYYGSQFRIKLGDDDTIQFYLALQNGAPIYDEVFDNANIQTIDISSAEVSSIPAQKWTGSEIEPYVTVTLNGEKIPGPFSSGGKYYNNYGTSGYILLYEDNVDEGTGKTIVQGIGKYSGRIEIPFQIGDTQITPPMPTIDVDISDADIYINGEHSSKNTKVDWTGKPVEPEIAVWMADDSDFGSSQLTQGKDYVVSFANNTNIGTATVTVTGQGAYKGSKTVSFEIVGGSGFDETSSYNLSDVWSFGNSVQDIPLVYYRQEFGPLWGWALYLGKNYGHSEGVCYGMVASIIGSHDYDYPSPKSYTKDGKTASSLSEVGMDWRSNSLNMSAIEYVMRAHISLNDPSIQQEWDDHMDDLTGLVNAVLDNVNGKGEPVSIYVGEEGAHELLATGIGDNSSLYTEIKVYDCNGPNFPQLDFQFGSLFAYKNTSGKYVAWTYTPYFSEPGDDTYSSSSKTKHTISWCTPGDTLSSILQRNGSYHPNDYDTVLIRQQVGKDVFVDTKSGTVKLSKDNSNLVLHVTDIENGSGSTASRDVSWVKTGRQFSLSPVSVDEEYIAATEDAGMRFRLTANSRADADLLGSDESLKIAQTTGSRFEVAFADASTENDGGFVTVSGNGSQNVTAERSGGEVTVTGATDLVATNAKGKKSRWTNLDSSNTYTIEPGDSQVKPAIESAVSPAAFFDKKVVYVDAAGNHSAAILEDGSLWAWGCNDEGQIGDGTYEDRPTPVKIMDGVVSVSLGNDNSAALKSDGSLWMWGRNKYGQVGDGTTTTRTSPVKIMEGVSSVSLGASTCAAVKNDGTLWVWGYNGQGGLGLGEPTSLYDYKATPTRLASNVSSVSLGNHVGGYVTTSGYLYMWGANAMYGNVGTGTNENVYSPVQIMTGVKSVEMGELSSSAALKNDGSLWTWGTNSYGMLGDGDSGSRNAPAKVADGVNAVSFGSDFALVRFGASLKVCGSNRYGQIGIGSTDASMTSLTEALPNVAMAAAGNSHALAIDADGNIYSWGRNNRGQLGTGDTKDGNTAKIIAEGSSSSAGVEVPLIDISNATVTNVPDVVYTGGSISQSPVVTLDGKTLDEGWDYEVTYGDNISAGNSSVTIQGKGMYIGSVTKGFTISKISLENATFNPIADVSYTGKAQEPSVVAQVNGRTLVQDEDYKATYKNNVNPGTATVTIEGIGNYSGTASTTFKIVKPTQRDLSNATIAAISGQTYTGKPITPSLRVSLDGKDLVSGTDFEAAYSSNTNAGTASVKVTGKGNYTGTKSATFKINAANLSGATISGMVDKPYTGKAQTQNPTVKLGTATLTSGTDYTIAYKDNVNVGTATVTVTGKGNYTGTKSATFKINAAPSSSKVNLSKATVSGLKAKTYTGKALAQSPVVKVGNKTLKSGTDYTVSYKNNKNVGTATVTVTGKGNYTGTKSATFKINKAKQPMTAKAANKTAKVKTLKKKAVTLTKTVTVKKKQGTLSYKNVSTQKAAKKFKVNAKKGTITVPKGTKKGTYKVKVKVTAKGNANYKSGSKTVTVKVTVK